MRPLSAKTAPLVEWGGLGCLTILASFSLLNAVSLVPLILLGPVSIGIALWQKIKRNQATKQPSSTANTMIAGCFLILAAYTFVRSWLEHGLQPTWSSFDRHLPLIVVGLIGVFLSTSKRAFGLVELARLCAVFMISAAVYYSIARDSLYGDATVFAFGQTISLPFVNKLLLAQIWTLAGILCLVGIRQPQAWWSKLLSILGYFSALYAVSILATSRGPMLVLMAQLPLVIFLLVLPRSLTTGKVLKTIALTIIVSLSLSAVLIAVLIWTDADILPRLTSALTTLSASGAAESSLGERAQMYQAALQAIQQSPLIGHGVADRLASTRAFLANDFKNYSHFHNFAFNLMIDGGVISLILFLAPSGVLWWLAFANRSFDNFFATYAVTIPPLVLGLSNSILHTAETGAQYLLALVVIGYCIQSQSLNTTKRL